MDLSEALATSLTAIVTADSGSGGLSNTSSSAYIQRSIVQIGHQNFDSDRAVYWNSVVLDVFENAKHGWGTGASAKTTVDFIARLTIRTLRDEGRAKQNACSERLKSKIDGVTPASQTGWNFSPLSFLRASQGPSDSKSLAYVMEFAGVGSASASSGNAELIGRQASVTFSGTEGTGIGSTLIGQVVQSQQVAVTRNVTRFLDRAARKTIRTSDSGVTVEFEKISAVPVVVTGTPAVLVVFSDTANNRKITYTNAIVTRIEHVAPNGPGSQKTRMTFETTATGAAGTNPVVAA
jgi:hypothetical protein